MDSGCTETWNSSSIPFRPGPGRVGLRINAQCPSVPRHPGWTVCAPRSDLNRCVLKLCKRRKKQFPSSLFALRFCFQVFLCNDIG